MLETNEIAQLPFSKAIRVAWYALIFIVFFVIFTFLFSKFDWSWTLYSILIGLLFGIMSGVVVLVKVTEKVQAVGIGAVLGLGTDFTVSSISSGTPSSAINSLASLVSSTTASINEAATSTKIPIFSEFHIALFLWCIIITLAIMMIFGSLAKESDDEST